MVDFWQTLEGQTFRSQLKTLSHNIGELISHKESEEEVLTKQIYAQLVAIDFGNSLGLSYESLYQKARESAKEYFKNHK